MSPTNTALDRFAEWIVSSERNHAVNERVAIESFVDTIGCMAAGFDAEPPTRLRRYIVAAGEGPCPILLSPLRSTRE